MTSFNTLSGYEARIIVGAKAVGASLKIGFENLRESDVLAITNHHIVAKGSYDTFALPADVHAGMSSYGTVTPASSSWRYASAPAVSWVAPGIATVSVTLASVLD